MGRFILCTAWSNRAGKIEARSKRMNARTQPRCHEANAGFERILWPPLVVILRLSFEAAATTARPAAEDGLPSF
jgi:hypothetical protein